MLLLKMLYTNTTVSRNANKLVLVSTTFLVWVGCDLLMFTQVTNIS